jgi:glutamate synthase domain-containing protein 2
VAGASVSGGAGSLSRYLPWLLCGFAAVGGLALWSWSGEYWCLAAGLLGGLLFWQGILDLRQTRHALLRNYPVSGWLRFILENFRPEIRQYFLESDTEELPFSRTQRAMVYQRAKSQNDKRPFGTLIDLYRTDVEWLTHSARPVGADPAAFRVRVGGPDCRQPYDCSVLNISAMSFGALSANAIQALNRGAKLGGFAHDTGEGSISAHHRAHGGDLIWQVASGYFGCRDAEGRFDPESFAANAADPQVKMIEIKLSQGAKPGHGGMLPGAKVSAEIAAARGVPQGVDCISPAVHSAFDSPGSLIDFICRLRELSGGKPIGIKLCIGHPWEWFGIAKAIRDTGRGPDFIVVDGSEGGTGAAPAEFSDHIGMPLRDGLRLVHNTLVGIGWRDHIRIGASGKVVSAFDIALMRAIGADWCNSARGFMFALGCIQSRSCHTDRCPTGVATQNALRQRALVVPDKAQRVWNFHRHTLEALAELLSAAGLHRPQELNADYVMVRVSRGRSAPMSSMLPTVAPGCLLDGVRMPLDTPKAFMVFWEASCTNVFGYDPEAIDPPPQLPPGFNPAPPVAPTEDRAAATGRTRAAASRPV